MAGLRVTEAAESNIATHSADPEPTARAAERVARSSYGKLIAILAAATGDIQIAEDALGDAFERALQSWPTRGVPRNPEAWLLTVARNRQRDVLKSTAWRTTVSLDDDAVATVISVMDDVDPGAIPDERLGLLFACAHPAIALNVRTPLMLQTVLGLDARQIGLAFAVPASTMAQRLVRAKRRIRNTRIRFSVPGRADMPARLDAVLEALYGAYAMDGWLVSGETFRDSLAAEAHYLAVTLADLLADEPEAFGLAALISYSLARAYARGSRQGFVPLDEQDPGTWDGPLIEQGERFLRRAHAFGRPGRFQLEAATQSVHCARARSGYTDWSALARLYRALVSIAPTLGARVALAATMGRLEGPEAGLSALDRVDGAAVRRFQPAWATRGHLLAEAGRVDEAIAAFDRAISLTTEREIRAYLERRRAELAGERP